MKIDITPDIAARIAEYNEARDAWEAATKRKDAAWEAQCTAIIAAAGDRVRLGDVVEYGQNQFKITGLSAAVDANGEAQVTVWGKRRTKAGTFVLHGTNCLTSDSAMRVIERGAL